MDISTVTQYTNLGLVFNEFLDLTVTAKAAAKWANRALGLVITKCKAIGGTTYDVFKKLFHSLKCHNLGL